MQTLNATAFWRTATVVRDGRDVTNQGDFQSGTLQGTDGGFTSGTRTAHQHFDLTHSLFDRSTGCIFSGGLGCKRRSFLSALKATRTSGGPGDCFSLDIRDRNDRVIESRSNVRNPSGDVLFNFTRTSSACRFSHFSSGDRTTYSTNQWEKFIKPDDVRIPNPITYAVPSSYQPPCDDRRDGYERWCECADLVQEDPYGGDDRDKRRCPSTA